MFELNNAVTQQTLRNLSADVLAMIMDYVDSVALVRTFLIGDTNLNDKLMASVTRFEHTVECSWRPVFSPKIVSRFRALTHVSVLGDYGEDHSRCITVHEVDIMSLPSTLRSLELDFANAFLCLIDLPPVDSDLEYFSPRLRSGLKDQFPHLERLTWSPNFAEMTDDWDLLQFAKDLSSWPLVLDPWPYDLPALTLDDALEFPSTTSSLGLYLSSEDSRRDIRKLDLPSLTCAEVILRDDYDANLFDIFPSTLTTLRCPPTEDKNRCLFSGELAPLSLLTSLTELQFHPRIFDTSLAQVLPRSLTKLEMKPEKGEFEAFAHLPAGLLILDVHCEYGIYSSTTEMILEIQEVKETAPYKMFEFESRGAPDVFMPSSTMREIVGKLPKLLKQISLMIFLVVRPRDWDVLPREALQQLRSSESYSSPVFIVPDQNGLHLENLPQFIGEIVFLNGCTVPMAKSLSRFVRSLELYLFDVPYVDFFVALSQSTPILTKLCMIVDVKFELDQLGALNVPLKELSIQVDLSHGASRSEELKRLESTRIKETGDGRIKVPRCLHSLRKLAIGSCREFLTDSDLVSIFEACRDLSYLSVEGVMPANLISLLPPKLVSFNAELHSITVDAFHHLPKSLRAINITENKWRGPDNLPEWEMRDLYRLPPQLRSITLSLPRDGHTSGVQALLEDVATKFHHDDVRIKIRRFDLTLAYSYTYNPQNTLKSLVALEIQNRRQQDTPRRSKGAKRKRSQS